MKLRTLFLGTKTERPDTKKLLVGGKIPERLILLWKATLIMDDLGRESFSMDGEIHEDA